MSLSATGPWRPLAALLLATGLSVMAAGCSQDDGDPAGQPQKEAEEQAASQEEVEKQAVPVNTVLWSGTVGGPIEGLCHLDISGYNFGAGIKCLGGCGDTPGSCILRWRKQTPPGAPPANWQFTLGVSQVAKDATILTGDTSPTPDNQLEFMCFCR